MHRTVGRVLILVMFGSYGMLMWRLAKKKRDLPALLLAVCFWSLAIVCGSGSELALERLRLVPSTVGDIVIGPIVRVGLSLAAASMALGILVEGGQYLWQYLFPRHRK